MKTRKRVKTALVILRFVRLNSVAAASETLFLFLLNPLHKPNVRLYVPGWARPSQTPPPYRVHTCYYLNFSVNAIITRYTCTVITIFYSKMAVESDLINGGAYRIVYREQRPFLCRVPFDTPACETEFIRVDRYWFVLRADSSKKLAF